MLTACQRKLAARCPRDTSPLRSPYMHGAGGRKARVVAAAIVATPSGCRVTDVATAWPLRLPHAVCWGPATPSSLEQLLLTDAAMPALWKGAVSPGRVTSQPEYHSAQPGGTPTPTSMRLGLAR